MSATQRHTQIFIAALFTIATKWKNPNTYQLEKQNMVAPYNGILFGNITIKRN